MAHPQTKETRHKIAEGMRWSWARRKAALAEAEETRQALASVDAVLDRFCPPERKREPARPSEKFVPLPRNATPEQVLEFLLWYRGKLPRTEGGAGPDWAGAYRKPEETAEQKAAGALEMIRRGRLIGPDG